MRALILTALVAAAPAFAQDSGDDHWDARLTAVAGEVVVHPAGGGDEVSGEADMPLEEGDRIVTSDDSTAEISLDGGSLIALSANSDFALENTHKSASIFSLSLGSLLAKIQKLGSQSMTVRSPTSVAAVRGTEFGVDVDGEESRVGVFDEGRVEVQGQAGGMTVLMPNQETSVARGQAPHSAAPLRRFLARRATMRERVRRLAFVRRNWKAMPPARRREVRAGALKRLRERRLNQLNRSERRARQRRMQEERRTPNERRAAEGRRPEEHRAPEREQPHRPAPQAKKRVLKRRPAPRDERAPRKEP